MSTLAATRTTHGSPRGILNGSRQQVGRAAPRSSTEPAAVRGGRREIRTRVARSATRVVAAGPGTAMRMDLSCLRSFRMSFTPNPHRSTFLTPATGAARRATATRANMPLGARVQAAPHQDRGWLRGPSKGRGVICHGSAATGGAKRSHLRADSKSVAGRAAWEAMGVDHGGAIVALVGAGAGAGVTLTVEWVRARIGDRASRRDALLDSCSNFTAAVARTRSLSYDLKDNPENQARIHLQLEEARVECERLRLLIDSKETQEAARWALRHLWAVWHLAERGSDPRASKFPDQKPHERLRKELTKVCIGVRRETGSRRPEDVFEDLD